MAVVVDRADLFFAEVSKQFRPIRDVLVVAGFFYLSKKVISLTYDIWTGIRVFGLSRLWRTDFRQKYGQWAVVTGCTRGIGRAYVDELARRKMDVILVGRSLPVLEKIQQEVVAKHGVKADVVVADFAAGQSCYGVIKEALDGRDIGILVNNVGVIPEYPMYLTENDDKILWDLINVNVAAATLMCKIVLPGMETRKRGAIINLASSAALEPLPLQAVYAATKAYVDYLSEALSFEVMGKGITIQTIDPSYVCTAMTEYSDWLNKPSVTVPTAETFVSCAIRTLGVTSRTTGYWGHSLQIYFSSLVPRELYMYGSLLLNRAFRTEALGKDRYKKDK